MKPRQSLCVSAVLLLSLVAGCSSLRLEGVDFAWPVESVVTVSDRNLVEEQRYAIGFNIGRVALEEFQDSTALAGKQVRMLRDGRGYLFLTGKGFKHLYVFEPERGSLSLTRRIPVPGEPAGRVLDNPALNSRPPFVELIDNGNIIARLTPEGVVSVEGIQQ